MNKNIIHLCALLIVAACTTFVSCEKDEMEEPGPYGAQLTRLALHQDDVIEVDKPEIYDFRRFKMASITKDELLAILQTGGWAETETYGLYDDGHLTENLLWTSRESQQTRDDYMWLAFGHDGSALLCSPRYGKQQIRYGYDEDIRIFTIGHILLPMSDFAKEAGVPDFYWDLGYSVFSVSEKELLLIGPYRVQTGDDYSPWVHTLRVFTHVSDAEVELWKAYYDQ